MKPSKTVLSAMISGAITVAAFAGVSGVRADDGPPLQCVRLEGLRLAPDGPATFNIEVRGEKIVAVEKGGSSAAPTRQNPVGPGCAVIRFDGAIATPGLIDAISAVGLVELGSEHGTHDTDNRHPAQPADTAIRAAVDTSLAFNARSVNLPVTRIEGVTTIVGAPSGGIISGFGFGADLLVGSRSEAVFATRLAQFASLAPRIESRAGVVHVLQRTFEEARRWPSLKAAFEKNTTAGLMTHWLDLEALQSVINGTIPLVIQAHRATEIETMLDVFGAMNPPIKLILAGGGEAWMVREKLAEAKVAVIMDPLQYGPGGFDQLHPRADAPALLEAAGVKVIFAQRDPHMTRKLRQLAGNAVREGMSWAGAIAAITANPAEAFGLDGRGHLEKDAIANIAVWTGDPLETTTSLKWLMIRGRIVPLSSRQTELFERYRNLPLKRANVRQF